MQNITIDGNSFTWNDNSKTLTELLAAAARVLNFHPGRPRQSYHLDRYSHQQARNICNILPSDIYSASSKQALGDCLHVCQQHVSTILVTTPEALLDTKCREMLIQIGCVSTVFDEAERAQQAESAEHKKLDEIFTQLRSSNPEFALLLLTGTPFTNSVALLWHLLALANARVLLPRQEAKNSERWIKKCKTEIISVLKGGSADDLNRTVQSAFVYFASLSSVLRRLVRHCSIDDPRVHRAWPNAIPPIDENVLKGRLTKDTVNALVDLFDSFKDKGSKLGFLDFWKQSQAILLHPSLTSLKKDHPTVKLFLQNLKNNDTCFKTIQESALLSVLSTSPYTQQIVNNNSKQVIFVKYHAQASAIKTMLRKIHPNSNPHVSIFHGQLKDKKRDEIIETWKNTINRPGLLVSTKAEEMVLTYPKARIVPSHLLIIILRWKHRSSTH